MLLGQQPTPSVCDGKSGVIEASLVRQYNTLTEIEAVLNDIGGLLVQGYSPVSCAGNPPAVIMENILADHNARLDYIHNTLCEARGMLRDKLGSVKLT